MVSLSHHLVLVGVDEARQAAGQRHSHQLREGDAERHASDDSHVALDDGRHQPITTLFVDFARGQRCVLQVGSAAVGQTHTTAGRNPPAREVHTAQPRGVVVHATATQSSLDSVHSQTPVVSSVVVHHCVTVGGEEGPFDLVTKDESRDSCDKFSHEDQRQEGSILSRGHMSQMSQ